MSSDDEEFITTDKERRKRKRLEKLSKQQIDNIIIGTQPEHSTKNHTTNTNYSARMQAITKKKFQHMFYLSTTKEMTRLAFADIWQQQQSDKTDVIIKTTKGFLLKTDNNKSKVKEILATMVNSKVLTSFKETETNAKPVQNKFTASYSCVIASVETDITDEEISNYLLKEGIEHRYCRRIRSKATNNWTTLIRIITAELSSFENLLNNGLLYKYKVYPVFPSKAPEPLPIPCAKCTQYTHTTESCPNSIICLKCKGKHHTNTCTTSLPEKCTACDSEDHQAWSTKCPKRPTKPIEGIPNTKIKTLNKRTLDIGPSKTKKSRIHQPMTIHDYIIETYITTINEDVKTDRQELINKVKKRFVDLYNIETTPVFSGNRLYILMFDMEESPSKESPTEPTEGLKIHQWLT